VLVLGGLTAIAVIAIMKKNYNKETDPLKIISSHIEDYLHGYPVKYEIVIGDFADIDYPDWKEKKITIRINTSLKQLYEDVKPNLLKSLQTNLNKKYFENIIIKFETM